MVEAEATRVAEVEDTREVSKVPYPIIWSRDLLMNRTDHQINQVATAVASNNRVVADGSKRTDLS